MGGDADAGREVGSGQRGAGDRVPERQHAGPPGRAQVLIVVAGRAGTALVGDLVEVEAEDGGGGQLAAVRPADVVGPARHDRVDEVAQAAGTIGYELLCAVTARVRREVVEEFDEALR